MKKDLILHKIPHGTDEWYKFRQSGIGGSEAATVLGINKYDTSVRLFHEKIGSVPQRMMDSERMLWGRYIEDKIAHMWQYYDGTKDGYVDNFNEGKIIRKCRNVNGYVVNPKYPWLFSSVDRLINKDGGLNLITGEALDKEAVLECKNMGLFSYKMWEDGVPIYFLVQVHIYMIVYELDYAEIAMLVDGGNLVVEKIERDEEFCERIISKTKEFWYDRVLPAKEAKVKCDAADESGNFPEAEKWEAEIQSVEPNPDGSEAYSQFMNERFVEERDAVTGTMELLHLAKKDRSFKQIINRIDKERLLIKNMFVQYLTNHGSETVDFGKSGYVNWSFRKGSKSRTFNNKLKEKPSEDIVEEEFKKLDPSF